MVIIHDSMQYNRSVAGESDFYPLFSKKKKIRRLSASVYFYVDGIVLGLFVPKLHIWQRLHSLEIIPWYKEKYKIVDINDSLELPLGLDIKQTNEWLESSLESWSLLVVRAFSTFLFSLSSVIWLLWSFDLGTWLLLSLPLGWRGWSRDLVEVVQHLADLSRLVLQFGHQLALLRNLIFALLKHCK